MRWVFQRSWGIFDGMSVVCDGADMETVECEDAVREVA